MDKAEIEFAISDLDKWFQFAESIGQQRLNNFFMAASILLAAIATVYPFSKFLASILAVAGLLFSFMWVIIGYRQSKFHRKLDAEIDRFIAEFRRKNLSPEKFAAHHIRQLKQVSPEVVVSGEQDDINLRLSQIESHFSTRSFLIVVPFLFYLVFTIVLLNNSLLPQPSSWLNVLTAVTPSALMLPFIIYSSRFFKRPYFIVILVVPIGLVLICLLWRCYATLQR